MTERPILFSAPMVRAILAGAKTQTRRIMKPQPIDEASAAGGAHIRHKSLGDVGIDALVPQVMRYGAVGDMLWVRETWAPQVDCQLSADRWTRLGVHHGPKPLVHFAADGGVRPWIIEWRPSIHMPRWASRIRLRITNVRVERLQDISRGDAMAEGCPFPNMAQGPDPRQWYAELWEQINGAGSWDRNPWVWALSFGREDG